MKVIAEKRHGISYLQVWFPETPAQLAALTYKASVIEIYNVDFDLRKTDFAPAVVAEGKCVTTFLDLGKSEALLRQELDPKSCRYEIRKSEKLFCQVTLNDTEEDEAFYLVRDFIKRSGYRTELGRAEWQACRDVSELNTVRYDGKLIAAHLILLDAPNKARMFFSATHHRDDKSLQNTIGPLNRRLHWEEVLYYKKRGFAQYDFGGVGNEPGKPHDIGRFKLSFGGDTKNLNDFVMIPNPMMRSLWRGARHLKGFAQNFIATDRQAD